MLESQNEYKQGCTDFVHISSNNDKEMYLIFVDFRVFFIYHKYTNISFILTDGVRKKQTTWSLH